MTIILQTTTALPLVRRRVRLATVTIASPKKSILCPRLAASSSFISTNRRFFSFIDTKFAGVSSTDKSPFIKREDRPALRPSLYHVTQPNASRIKRKNRWCPTRDMNYTPDLWAKHKAPGRHIRHLFTVFHCASFQRLVFPDLFLTATVAAGVTYYNEMIGLDNPFYFDKTAFTSCCMAISVLAGFRLNTSYSRFNEARMILGQVNNTSRDLMGQACMFLNETNKVRTQKLLKAFSVALHFHLNVKGGYYKLDRFDPETKPKILAAYRDEMREIFFPDDQQQQEDDENHDVGMADFQLICEAYESGSHVPLLILSHLRKTFIENQPPIDPIYALGMDEQVSNLTVSLGGCERILRTPVPTTFTTNTSRLMSLWSLSLPFALYPLTGPHWTLPFSVILSYVVLSIEDVGAEIEEPFHVLPLRQYTEATADSLDAIVKSYEICPIAKSNS